MSKIRSTGMSFHEVNRVSGRTEFSTRKLWFRYMWIKNVERKVLELQNNETESAL